MPYFDISRWKWSLKQPIIAGKKKRSTADKEQDAKMFAVLLEEVYSSIVKHLEDREMEKSATSLDTQKEK